MAVIFWKMQPILIRPNERAIKVGDFMLEIKETFCERDDLYEELDKQDLGIGPIWAEVVELAMTDVLWKT